MPFLGYNLCFIQYEFHDKRCGPTPLHRLSVLVQSLFGIKQRQEYRGRFSPDLKQLQINTYSNTAISHSSPFTSWIVQDLLVYNIWRK